MPEPVNVKLKVPVGESVPESKTPPVSLEVVCDDGPLFVQRTVSPGSIVTCAGVNWKLLIVTSTVAAAGGQYA